MTKTAKISIALVSIALLAVGIVLIRDQETKVTDYHKDITPLSVEMPDRISGLPKVDQAELQKEYQKIIKEKVISIKLKAGRDKPVEKKMRDDLLAMIVPKNFRDLHLSLVRLISEVDNSSVLLAQVNEVTQSYTWLNN